MRQQTFIILLVLLTSLFIGCKSTKYVPKDRYLLKKNVVVTDDKTVSFDDIEAIIRQQPNRKFLGVKFNLYLFNSIDSLKIDQKRAVKNLKIRKSNKKKILKRDRINQRRIKRSLAKGRAVYTEKIVELKDTLEPSLFLREWLKYRVGEQPVIFDSLLFSKSTEQLSAFLKNKGYYYADVQANVQYNKHQKAKVFYNLKFGKQYLIDSVYLIAKNELLADLFNIYLQKYPLKKLPFDVDLLEDYRSSLSKNFRNNGIYQFNDAYINFIIDTNKTAMTVSLGVEISDKLSEGNGSEEEKRIIPHAKTYVKDVHFHLIDTLAVSGSYKKMLDSLSIQKNGKYLATLDTLFLNSIPYRNSKEINESRAVNFYYNGEIFVTPEVLETQSLLEKGALLKENLVEDTYARFQQLNLFQTIKIELVEVADSNSVEVHYYLIPSKKASFSFQPRVSSSNGYLGVSAGLNYANKNIFKGAEKLTFSINGGFQSQPVIFEETDAINDIKAVTNRLYQFEIGPSLKYEVPGLMLIKNSKFNKTRNGKTFISTAYSFQNRDVFSKEIFQLNYIWQYDVGKTQRFQIGLPGISQVKFVSINKSSDFDQQLNELNDLFLKNTYSNQFIWQDWKLVFELKKQRLTTKKYDPTFYMRSSLDLAGNLLHLFKKYQVQDTTGQFIGQSRLFGLVYSQFTRLDNEIIYTQPFSKTKSLNLRLLTGAGLPYGNSNKSMPYDYSFYAGGSNDVRGWRARALGPGSYEYYLDTARTIVQIADIRLSASVEYRFQFSDFLKGALFVDAGNIWTLREDEDRKGSQFSKDWYNEIAIASGVGFRMDFDYFIIRFDLGFKLHNPALPKGEKWFFNSHNEFYQRIADFIELNKTNGITVTESKLVTKPFTPQISFGIGYPF